MDGFHSEKYPDDWTKRRKKVYKRDGYHCQNCNAAGGWKGDAELHAHHEVPIAKGGSHEYSNLTTLCHSCHEQEHGHPIYSGKSNKKKKDPWWTKGMLSFSSDAHSNQTTNYTESEFWDDRDFRDKSTSEQIATGGAMVAFSVLFFSPIWAFYIFTNYSFGESLMFGTFIFAFLNLPLIVGSFILAMIFGLILLASYRIGRISIGVVRYMLIYLAVLGLAALYYALVSIDCAIHLFMGEGWEEAKKNSLEIDQLDE